jgi:hypothetical protein
MANLFEEDVLDEDSIVVENIEVEKDLENSGLDARRKLEKMFEDKRLKHELDDFVDY